MESSSREFTPDLKEGLCYFHLGRNEERMNEDRNLEMVRNEAEEPCNNTWLLRKIGKSRVMNKGIGDLALMVFIENARGIVKRET